mgnify:CR=1 FL=1
MDTDSITIQSIKRIVYIISRTVLRFYWFLLGGRKIRVFGAQYRFLSTTTFPSYRTLQFPKKEIFSSIVRYGDYVQMHAAYRFISELQHAPVIVDVGAHHGSYSIVLGKLVQQKKGKLIAIEPHPHSFAILKKNVQLNLLEDTVVCENIAVMEQEGHTLFTDSADQSYATSSLQKKKFSVTTTPLSALIKKHSLPHIDMLIIDVEGAELHVLHSIDWERTTVNTIYCELHPYNWKLFGFDGDAMSEFLRVHNFRCFDMYFKEHTEFRENLYIGPTIFVRQSTPTKRL